MVIVLDNIRSDYNVGSIFRTCDAAGCDALYLCGVTPTPVDRFKRENTKLTKVSLGAEHTVPWKSVQSTVLLIRRLKKKRYTILALEKAHGSIPLFDFSLKRFDPSTAALVLGGEVSGLSQDILSLSDHILEIPMRGSKESLNVSVAFGIAVYFLVVSSKL